MTTPQTLLRAWHLRARKRFGQNFLKDMSVADRIVAGAEVSEADAVMEIGAGLGALTVPLGRIAGRVVAIERDRDLVQLLRAELLAEGLTHVQLACQDILKLDFEQLIGQFDRKPVVLGNLPYNISSPILIRLIRSRTGIERAVLMLQKELVQRLCALPGGKTYGRISVMLQYGATVTPLFEVSADRFYPAPKVDSAVIRIDFKDRVDHPASDELLLSRVVQAAFGRRRKTLKNALSGSLLGIDGAQAARLLAAADIDDRRRAETLSVEEFVRLANTMADRLPTPG